MNVKSQDCPRCGDAMKAAICPRCANSVQDPGLSPGGIRDRALKALYEAAE